MRHKINMRVRLMVREIAESKGISRTRLSRTADVNYWVIASIWNNPYHELMFNTLLKLSRALNVDVGTLYVVEDE